PGQEREYVFVQVSTDEGLTGWGEITGTSRWANRAVCAILAQVSELIEGDDPTHIEAIWNKVFRAFTYMGTRGATSNVVSGIDIALWDIRGKQLGVPIYELFGGPVRGQIALYTHPGGGRDPQALAAHCKAIVETGHTALKTDPFPRQPEEANGYLSGQMSAEGEEHGEQVIAAIREAVGPGTEILIDCHGRFDVATAIRLAKRLAPYNIGWFEEPVAVESYHALRQVREHTNVPICVGERLQTRYEFVPILENELADYIMPDVTWAGGISELKKISTMAEAYYVPMSPHDASGPINVLAGAHTMMTVPNFYKLETSRAKLNAYDVLIDPPLDIRDGHLHLSKRPGLGIEMKVDYLRHKAIAPFSG
ncbi:mandelate racemase/muconate lactonizing enzyme family protein, partial [Candidatus Poribacteria bacterium]|nr:mandelate racemase/muconate lactonizing enzyme family protein [Candidatus Poribacteria bacterium]